jgi:citrate lyase beta subunit
VRHFAPLRPAALQELFLHPPNEVPANADPALLATSLGATLYCPGNRPRLATDLARMTAAGATSIVVCLEDSVRDAEVAAAEDNTIRSLRAFAAATPAALRPLLFVRAREPRQLPAISAGLGRHRGVLTGFVAPKVDAGALAEWLSVLRILRRTGGPGRLMPVLESAVLAQPETRLAELVRLRAVLDADRGSVLAVRLGGTDLAAAFGLRRPRELTVWELHPVADALSDIIGVLGRGDGTGFPISGVVWEYFSPGPSPGSAPPGGWKRAQDRFIQPGGVPDTFAREIALDLAHGLIGKTVIHPSHVATVNAAYTVDHEEFADARDVLSVEDGGAAASAFGNKMNEARPHRSWAVRVLRRATVYGVRRPGLSPVDLAAAVQDAASRLPRREPTAVGTVS